MNNPHTPPADPRPPRLRSLFALLLAALAPAIALVSPARAQTQTITVNAGSVVRDIPAGLGGVCIGTDFWTSLTPNYRDEFMRARVGLARIVAYPFDTNQNGNYGSLEILDRRVAQIINAGGAPLFIQCIESEGNTGFKEALLRLDGTPYPSTDTTTPIRQRVATNITYLVSRYRSAPYNLTTQYWEIGNEPDIEVNYPVQTTQEYIDFFLAAHNRLIASGVRNNVLLAGPVISFDYGFGNGSGGARIRDDIMNDFLAACGSVYASTGVSPVDIVTRHQYAGIRIWESIPYTQYTLLNNTKQTLHFDHTFLGYSNRGELALQNAMNAEGLPASIGTGITEMNLWWNENGTKWFGTITHGLWFLISNRNALYNPRSLVTNGFQFDRVNSNPAVNTNDHAFFKADFSPDYPYWATYVHGALTGDQVLAQTSSNSHLVVSGTKDASYIYVMVINRHDTTAFTANVTISNAGGVGTPTEHVLSATQNTLVNGTAVAGLGTSFSRSFPPFSATIFRYPRTSAPVPPTPPAPPTTTVLSTSFDSTPTGMLPYASGFTPVVASGRLQLTSTIANTRTAVVFAGHSLPAARNRAQIRFGFQVANNNAEGFVFGAYSANPGAVGNPGTALGYNGQANRLWGVKVDNNPDELSVISSVTNDNVDGWATKRIPYYGVNMFMVVDYEGPDGTVRARMYQGNDDSGTLVADVTNRVGVPATLPTGTVFGFTGATGTYSQNTYIHDLVIRADNASGGTFVIGQEVIVDNPQAVRAGTWTLNQTTTAGFYGSNYDHDGNTNKGSSTATYTPSLTGSGYRTVYVRYCAASSRASNARYIVNHAGGSQTVLRDQRTFGGQWVSIGTWQFNHGTGGNVVLSNQATDGFVIADAIRFVNVAAP